MFRKALIGFVSAPRFVATHSIADPAPVSASVCRGSFHQKEERDSAAWKILGTANELECEKQTARRIW